MARDPYPTILANRKKPTTPEGKWSYIRDHDHHNQTISLPVKRWYIQFPDQVAMYGDTPPTAETFFHLIEMPYHQFWRDLEHYVEEFESQHTGYVIEQGGRSGGWFHLFRSAGYDRQINYDEYEQNTIGSISSFSDMFYWIREMEALFEVVWDFDDWVRARIVELVEFCATHRFVEREAEIRDTVIYLAEVEINPETGEEVGSGEVSADDC